MGAWISRFPCTVIGILWPAYQSFKALESGSVDSATRGTDAKRWLRYWIVHALALVAEGPSDLLLDWFPGYYPLKIGLFYWMAHPRLRGAEAVYARVVRDMLKLNEGDIDEGIDSLQREGARIADTAAELARKHGAEMAIIVRKKVEAILTPKRPQRRPQRRQRITGRAATHRTAGSTTANASAAPPCSPGGPAAAAASSSAVARRQQPRMAGRGAGSSDKRGEEEHDYCGAPHDEGWEEGSEDDEAACPPDSVRREMAGFEGAWGGRAFSDDDDGDEEEEDEEGGGGGGGGTEDMDSAELPSCDDSDADSSCGGGGSSSGGGGGGRSTSRGRRVVASELDFGELADFRDEAGGDCSSSSSSSSLLSDSAAGASARGGCSGGGGGGEPLVGWRASGLPLPPATTTSPKRRQRAPLSSFDANGSVER